MFLVLKTCDERLCGGGALKKQMGIPRYHNGKIIGCFRGCGNYFPLANGPSSFAVSLCLVHVTIRVLAEYYLAIFKSRHASQKVQ